MHEVSIFLDESGSDGMKDKFYILALVIHDQEDDISENIARYEQDLREKGLPDIPFHASPLLNGHRSYTNLDPSVRKKLLSTFRVFFRHTPIRYHCIKLKTSEYATVGDLSATMRKRIVDFVFEHLEFFQKFEKVKVYYDDGQRSVADAVHKALDYALATDSVIYKDIISSSYRLSQIADYICTMELTALKYQNNVSTPTDKKFFGSGRDFKKSIKKELQRKEFK